MVRVVAHLQGWVEVFSSWAGHAECDSIAALVIPLAASGVREEDGESGVMGRAGRGSGRRAGS